MRHPKYFSLTTRALRQAVVRAVLFGALFAVSSSSTAWACSCAAEGGFLAVTGAVDAIVAGKVDNYQLGERERPLAMSFSVERVLRGSGIEKNTGIRIWGDNGAQCRPYISTFPLGSRWVMAIVKGRRGAEKDDYYVPICGTYWLPLADGKVKGFVEASGKIEEELDLEQLAKRLNK